MRKRIKEKLNETLAAMASDMPLDTASALIWGDVEIPAELWKECEVISENEEQ